MKDADSRQLWETYVSENQQYFERELSNIRASLQQGKLGIPLADLLRDESQVTDESKGPVKVTYTNLQRPYVLELDDGSRVPNYVRHWSQKPGEMIKKDAYGNSIQHALTHDSSVSSGADKIGPETILPRVIDTIIIDVEHDSQHADTMKKKQQADAHAAADIAKWKHD